MGNLGETMHSFLEAQGNSLVLEYYQIMVRSLGLEIQSCAVLILKVNRWLL